MKEKSDDLGDANEERFRTLWQLAINEARLHSERTSFFLVANAFLLTGFAVLRQAATHGIEFVPVAVGITFAFLHFVNINYGEKVRLVWEEMLRENAPAKGILERRDEMFERTWWLRFPVGRASRNAGSWVIPMLFLAMWICLMALQVFSSFQLSNDAAVSTPEASQS